MSLTDKTLSGFIWAFAERFGIQVLQMVVFIILARKLTPKAFGLIGMLAVFIAISRSLTDSGFGQALIQKKDADGVDFSSVFYINLAVSIGLYCILFASAPLIASFYGESILINLIRVLGIKFIIEAFSMVQIARLTKEVKFKKLMLAKLPSTLLGGVAGIGAAYMGLGVWSLIIQQLVDITAYSIQIWIQSKWTPIFVFDWDRIKSLFNFGSKMMIEGVLGRIYQNFYEIIIGHNFSTAQVGFYTQANKIRQLPVQNISNALARVTFPVLSEIQNDDVRLKRAYTKIIRQIFFLTAPLMIGGIVLAKPLFGFVLTDKWLPAVPYFQWLCVSGLFYPVNQYNLEILKVKGRSDLFLWLGIVKKTIAIIGILIIVQYSVLGLVIFRAFFSILAYFINSYYSGRFIDYNIFEQVLDIWKFIFIAIIMGLIMWGSQQFFVAGDLLTIIIEILTGTIIYFGCVYVGDYNIIKDSFNFFKRIKR